VPRLTYHPLKVLEVIEETADACSLRFEIPTELKDKFRYKPGQHLQLHVPLGEKPLPRCYSLSSMPYADEAPRVTVKRVNDGRASNWICDRVKPGDVLEVAPPAGVFTPKSLDGEFLLFAGGSGITPVFSIIRSVLAAGSGSLRLVYANRDERSVIFAPELTQLSREFPDRLHIIHWLDSVQGIPSQAQLTALCRGHEAAQCFICGPALFMDAAAAALREAGVPHAQVHIERFVSLPEDADDAMPAISPAAGAGEVSVEVELDGVMQTVAGREGQLLIEALEEAGLQPPYSCRAGACATCMCKLEDGEVELLHNHALTEQDLADTWILSCQAVMRSPRIRVRYPG
jgi:3-ketosteroid 9alpha-monooxygenase subunit B